MKKIIIYGMLILFPIISQAQKQGNYWKLGRRGAISFNGGGQVQINDTCKEILGESSTTMCDSRGNLLFYSNGIKVYNRLDRLMPNGSNFNHGTISDGYIAQDYLPIWNGVTSIPFVGDSNKFYIFYVNLEYYETNGGNVFPNKLKYLVVDKTLDGGLGDVVYKDSCIACGVDTLLSGNIFTIRHGNGKDWWLIARKYHSSLFYKVLIDSSGVHKADTQSVGIPYMETGYFQGFSSFNFQGSKLSYIFSPTDTGKKFGRIEFFDFDRCTGIISHQKKEDYRLLPDTLGLYSCMLSPNGRYYYTTDYDKIFQMDMQAPNLIASKILIARADNTPTPSPSHFYQLKLGPDGKIYVGFYGGNYYMSVINNPDNAGAACNFVYKQLYFGGFTGGVLHTADGALPNNPNYALGKIDCGVGMEEQLAVGVGQLVVYPNPVSNVLICQCANMLINTIEITDVLGRTQMVRQAHHDGVVGHAEERSISINVETLPNGIYFIKATDKNGNVMNGKFVKE
jgi:hypothetical protein